MALGKVQTSVVQKLGDMGRLKPDQISQLVTSDEMSGEALDKLLLTEYKVSEFQLLTAKARAFELNPINVKNFKVNERTFQTLEKEFCKENKVLPLGQVGDYIVIIVADPFNLSVVNKVQDLTKKKVHRLLGLESEIGGHLKEKEAGPVAVNFGDVMGNLEGAFAAEDGDVDISESDLEEDSSPIVQLASRIIEDAYFSGGSDIHIEPFEKFCRVRVRIDGNCQEKLQVPSKAAGALLARLKVMANLDIAEKRLPQDGRIVFKNFTKKNLDIDLRVSTAPLNHGEGAVMRILDKQKSTLPLPALGFSPENLTMYRELIQRPYGMILHCGPTGSGKSMTLYSALNEINTPDVVIRTAEDPIEYTLPGLLQMQMARKIGLDFKAALRAFLRQDPDIILVGEIRDSETAQIAIEAALTGHMLFSTTHTNDAPSTIQRMGEMEIEPFMISAAMVCICAQRLGRRVCKTCRVQYIPEGNEAEIIWRAIKYKGPIYKANRSGCPTCGGKGMKGRVGIHELMATSEELVAAINKRVTTADLKRVAIRNGMRTLHQDSMLKVKEGTTTMEEALANITPDIEDIDAILEQAAIDRAADKAGKEALAASKASAALPGH